MDQRLFLLFHLGRDRYLLDARQIVEILPLVDIIDLPQAPAGVLGVINYRGTLVPALDMGQIVLGRPVARRLHTRIILVRHVDPGGAAPLLGLVVEKVTDTRRIRSGEFSSAGISAAHRGPVVVDEAGVVQLVGVQQLLPASILDELSRAVAA
jgi:chemotaxis-related protein WspB